VTSTVKKSIINLPAEISYPDELKTVQNGQIISNLQLIISFIQVASAFSFTILDQQFFWNERIIQNEIR
jgi:hypothetical protein